MAKTIEDQIIALAGIAQALALVEAPANNRSLSESEIAPVVLSILTTDAPSTASIYGGIIGVQRGVHILKDKILNEQDRTLIQYLITLLHLERKLSKNPTMLKTLSDGIEQAKGQAEYFDQLNENVVAKLADVYYQTISQLQPRIIVNGDPNALQDSRNVAKIRTLLLGAMRSTVLWRQCGGKRWDFFLKRKQLLSACEALQKKIQFES